jgi:phospholipid/cholesterol/gamma-HCH transport system substrate-binding protein
MQKKSSNKITLGLFVSVGLFLFIAGIYFVGKKQQMFNSTFRITGVFKDVSGLQVGNNVRFDGINVGIIESIEIVSDSTVKVDLSINEKDRRFIRKDAKAIVGSDGLMGNKIVVITAGAGGQASIKNGDKIATSVPVSMDEIMAKLKVTVDNSANITDDLSAIMDNIRAGKGTIGKLFMDTTFSNTLDKTLVNIEEGAGGFKQNMDAAKHSFLLRRLLKKKDPKDSKK